MEAERNIDRLQAAVELLNVMIQEEAEISSYPTFTLAELNHVLIVAGFKPVVAKKQEVDVIDTV